MENHVQMNMDNGLKAGILACILPSNACVEVRFLICLPGSGLKS